MYALGLTIESRRYATALCPLTRVAARIPIFSNPGPTRRSSESARWQVAQAIPAAGWNVLNNCLPLAALADGGSASWLTVTAVLVGTADARPSTDVPLTV